MSILLVFLGAGLGGVARHGVNVMSLRVFGTGFPWHTLGVNVVGSLIMGIVVGWLAMRSEWPGGGALRLFVATGVLGGFTTFSAFSLDAWLLWERGQGGAAAAYVAGSVAASLAGLGAGLAAMRAMT
jgi:CrcB protein